MKVLQIKKYLLLYNNIYLISQEVGNTQAHFFPNSHPRSSKPGLGAARQPLNEPNLLPALFLLPMTHPAVGEPVKKMKNNSLQRATLSVTFAVNDQTLRPAVVGRVPVLWQT